MARALVTPILGLVAALAAVASAGAAAAGTRQPLLGLAGGGLHEAGRLVALDPRTLDVRARGPRLPGWAFGFEYAWSPDRATLAFAPRPVDTARRLYLVDARRLRVVARVDLGKPSCGLAWPAAETIVALVGQAPCYASAGRLEELVVDVRARRVVARRDVSPPVSILAEQATTAGLALLLEAPAGGSRRLVLVDAGRVVDVALPAVRAAKPALALDVRGGRAYVVEPGWIVTEVDLRTGAAARHDLRPRPRRPATAAKGIVGSVASAAWTGRGVLAVAGGVARRNGSFDAAGAWLVDTIRWRARRIDRSAGSLAVAGALVVAFDGPYDDRANQARGRGASVYTSSGTRRCRALPGKRVQHARVRGSFVYVLEAPGYGEGFDVRTCRRTAYAIDGNLVWSLLVGGRGPPRV